MRVDEVHHASPPRAGVHPVFLAASRGDGRAHAEGRMTYALIAIVATAWAAQLRWLFRLAMIVLRGGE